MADIKKTIVEDHDGKIMTGKSPAMAEVDADVACRDERRDNVMYDRSRMKDEIHQKGEELPEPIRHKDESKGMAPCLPSINLSELATILRDPNMPSPKILNEVADKMMIRSEESESDDGSVSSGGIVGMKGLLDCIFEVSYRHEESASSDDDDDLFERFSREIPCSSAAKYLIAP
uniref:Uncharacterized protein n=1 Tax=Arion vulgaris TaxID=1028688 RepID=A0A0B6ZTM1_9EUPU